MSINANRFVNIIPATLNPLSSGFSLTGVAISKNATIPTRTVLNLPSLEAVQEYFGSSSDEVLGATRYFAGFVGAVKTPPYLTFYRYVDVDVASWLRGDSITTNLAGFQTVTTGTLNLSLNGVSIVLTGIDLSTATSFSNVASIIQTKLQAYTPSTPANADATVVYSSLFNAFILTNGATGDTSAIGYATSTPLAELLKWTELDGAVISQGESAQTPSATMDSLVAQYKNWFSFALVWKETVANNLLWGAWVFHDYAFVEWDNDSVDTSPISTTDYASQVAINKIGFSIPTYAPTLEVAFFTMGCIASVDYASTTIADGTITLAYKQQAGLTPTVTSTTNYDTLILKGYNLYGDVATKGNEFQFYQRGTITNNIAYTYEFTDVYANHVWLNDALQVNLLALLVKSKKLPYNQISYNAITTTVENISDQAINNGTITQGKPLDGVQISAIVSETGADKSTLTATLYKLGWYLFITDPSSVAMANRESPVCKYYYVNGGSIQKIDLTSTVVS